MAWTAWESQRYGFAFVNRWDFSEEERQTLRDAFARYLKWSVPLGLSTFGPAGAMLLPRAIQALQGTLEAQLAPGYGLCGGMCFAALDFFHTGIPTPRREGREDHPVPGSSLRTYLWKRQLDSIASDGAKFVSWAIFLNYVPANWPFRGGPRWLLKRSRQEWEILKASIDDGDPVPLGLVRDTEDLFSNHQVLAIGYDTDPERAGTIHLYDPNCPDKISSIRFTFGEEMLLAQESCGGVAPLRGFFCDHYEPHDPSEALS
jgi:hypothetical protein